MIENLFTLTNSESGQLAFKVFSFEDNTAFDHLQRQNYSTIILLKEGSGTLKLDVSEYNIERRNMMFISPYQPYMIHSEDITGIAMLFHSDFFCILKHDKEVSCNGVLFNNIYESPIIQLDNDQMARFQFLIDQMKSEMGGDGYGQDQLLVSYLKIFLITASRIKIEQNSQVLRVFRDNEEPFVLQSLKNAIEENYRSMHSASDYANLLNMSIKTLGRISKAHFNKTVMDLIAERIIIEAKRELYLTSKPVKVIAYELGFNDEYYFSRFFKTNTDVSPKLYRESVGFAKAERTA